MKHFLFITLVAIAISCSDITPIITDPDDLISLRLLNLDSIVIEGQFEVSNKQVVIVEVDTRIQIDEAFENVTLTTSSGHFIENGSMVHTKKLNDLGLLYTNIALPINSKDIRVEAQVKNEDESFKVERTINFKQVENLISVQQVNNNLIADDFTTFEVTANVDIKNEAINKLIFTTTEGSIIGTNELTKQQPLTENNDASIILKMPQTTDVFYITVGIPDFEEFNKIIPVQPISALAEEIIVEPSKINMKLNETNPINVYLKREKGKVSLGTKIEVISFQLTNNNEAVEVGRFTGLQNNGTDANENITFNFITDTGNIDTIKKVFLEVTSEGVSDPETIELNIIN